MPDRAPKIIMQDRAPQTVKEYINTFQQWKKWAKKKGLHVLPASGYEFGLYLAYLLKNAKSMSTINGDVYGVPWAHRKVAVVSQLFKKNFSSQRTSSI